MSEEKPKKITRRRTKYPKAGKPGSRELESRLATMERKAEAKKQKEKEYKASLVKIHPFTKFLNPEELASALNEYFTTTPFEEWTVTGLCLALDTTRATLGKYEKKEEFGDMVRKARLLVEHSYEMGLKHNGKAGDIFALKNMGWRDDRAFSLSGPDGGAIKNEWKIEVVDPVTKEIVCINEDQNLIEEANNEKEEEKEG